ncbi:hypothetical protein LCGC14_1149790 [marine sediment metagenome]|uniref:Uncharacterized protein n=1 Tax=marine sediment metagenome TaxID=412755 RepID=A0A0F9PDY0_9ZZZZ
MLYDADDQKEIPEGSSYRLTKTEKAKLKDLADRQGQNSINGLLRLLARAKKVTIQL